MLEYAGGRADVWIISVPPPETPCPPRLLHEGQILVRRHPKSKSVGGRQAKHGGRVVPCQVVIYLVRRGESVRPSKGVRLTAFPRQSGVLSW